jgi:autotransporter translocation and assembly factor TamB
LTKKWFKRSVIFLLSLLVIAGILAALLESRWGQDQIRFLVISALEKGKVKIQIGSVEGRVPGRLQFTKIELDFPKGSTLFIENLQAKISLLYLLKNEIRFQEVIASKIFWKSGKNIDSSTSFTTAIIPSLPFSLCVDALQASNVTVDQIGPFQLDGRIKIGSRQRRLLLDVKADLAEDTIQLKLLAKKNKTVRWSANLHLKDSSILDPLYKAPIHGALQLKMSGYIGKEQEMLGQFAGKAVLYPDHLPLSFQQIPWTFSSHFTHTLGKGWGFSRGQLNSELVKIRASGQMDSEGNLIEASGQMQSDKLLPAPFEGTLFTQWMLRKEKDQLIGKAIAQIPQLHAGPFDWKQVELVAECVENQGSFYLKGETWKTQGDFFWDHSFKITQLKLDAPQMKGGGNLEIFPDGSMLGVNEFTIDNLQILKPLAPEWNPYGQLHIKTVWEEQNVRLDMTASDLYLKSYYFQRAAFYSDLQNPFHELTGIFSIDVEKGRFRDLTIDSASLETTIEGDNWPFKLFAEGVWIRDFEAYFDGFWHFEKDQLIGSIDKGRGLFYNHPFSLKNPVAFESTPNKTSVSTTQIELEEASLTGRFTKEANSGDFYLRLNQFPLDFLSINPLEVSINGKLDFEGQMTEINKKIQGNFKADISQVEISQLGTNNPISAEGMARGTLDQDLLVFQGSLAARGQPLASLEMKLPIHLELQPWKTRLVYTKPTSGQFALNGRIEDFLDFFNLGTHWLSGNCTSNFRWSKTLRHPRVEGSFHLEDGYYENYFTGTQLKNLTAEIIADQETLYLRSFTATDGNEQGKVYGEGSMHLRFDERLPFKCNFDFDQFNFVQLGFIGAEANSTIQIEGNLDSAIALGEVHILKSDLSIPENLSKKPPDLEVVYLNAQKPPQLPPESLDSPYPFRLNLKIDAPKGVIIAGRGLQSEWKGNFVLEGLYSSPQPKGKLELLDGEFTFSGRSFKLTRGSLLFTGQPREIPHLDISGTIEQQGISIIVNLQGPLLRPQLTFQSVPPLSLSAIIAHLLFGQDISEINGLQALQLATSVANIAGQSPDILEGTRRSLGIDRLRIVSNPGSEDGESISIQVGKYIAKGVIVSISQSTENSAPDITIEVDIGSGFFFQAESDQLHEQGKFGLKWNRNY